jgi:hypothetical protein
MLSLRVNAALAIAEEDTGAYLDLTDGIDGVAALFK